MKSSLTANDVLSDIEFELVQGSISQSEFGRSVQAVKQHQGKIRSEVIGWAKQIDNGREMVSRLFQINDMLITLLQEMTTELQSLRLGLRRVARISQMAAPVAPVTGIPVTEENSDTPAALDMRELSELEGGLAWQSSTEVESAMRSEALQIGLEVRSTGIPIVGGLIKRMRIALHNLALFYVDRLAGKQVAVNQTYGDWILRLMQMHQHQQEQVELLSARVASLEARLVEAGEMVPSDTTL
jgi:hypothetical protein